MCTFTARAAMTSLGTHRSSAILNEIKAVGTMSPSQRLATGKLGAYSPAKSPTLPPSSTVTAVMNSKAQVRKDCVYLGFSCVVELLVDCYCGAAAACHHGLPHTVSRISPCSTRAVSKFIKSDSIGYCLSLQVVSRRQFKELSAAVQHRFNGRKSRGYVCYASPCWNLIHMLNCISLFLQTQTYIRSILPIVSPV